MSKYDQLAFASRPTFYLSAPTTTDQSGISAYSFSSNTLVSGGQPIIKGHASAFIINDTAHATITGNPAFRAGVTTELVLFSKLPDQETAIITADNGNGLFITPTSVLLRVTYNINESIQTLTLEIPWTDWHKKLHCIMTIGVNQVALTVNSKSKITLLTGVLDTTITTTQIGANIETGFNILIDGIGIYSRKILNKANAIDDDSRGHNIYATAIYGGVSTDFSSYKQVSAIELGHDDFKYFPGMQQTAYLYQFKIPNTDSANMYVAVETNDDSLAIEWAINSTNSATFTKTLIVPVTVSLASLLLNFRLLREPQQDFKMTIRVISDPTIFSRTPAVLTATGQPIFPSEIDDSIVNCSRGVDMQVASWHGVWLKSDSSAGQNPPKSIELIFKPEENGVIFSSADGQISTTAQSGYTMYLNGALVTDLSAVLMNQWNHLVLTKTTPTATSFYINTDGSSTPTKLSLLLMTAYKQVLNAGAVADMYKIAIGADDITITEAQLNLTEGAFENGQAFQLLGNNWSIVGSGGN